MKIDEPKTPVLLLLGALVGAACASSGEGGGKAAVWSATQPEAERLLADVTWLADDAREGRRAGTTGERESADWIAARLASLGVTPAGENGWLQPFPVALPDRDGGKSTIEILRQVDEELGVSMRLRWPHQLAPLFCSAPGDAEGKLVFAGYGIVDEDRGWNDYAGLDVGGAIVVLTRGTPPLEAAGAEPGHGEEANTQENPHGAPAGSSGWGGAGSIFHKVMEAKRRGAVAVLLAPHPDRFDEPVLSFDAGRTARSGIPALAVYPDGAELLVEGYVERVAALDRGDGSQARLTLDGTVKLHADVVRETSTAHNVLGRIEGRKGGRTVVVGAHFDHLGHGGEGSLAPDSLGEIHNGADDNASGTAAVLEIARCLVTSGPPEGDVVFAFWSGEELGLLGSEHWARNPTIDLDDVAMNVNLDMVGRAGDGVLQVLGAGTSEEFPAWLEQAGERAGLDLRISLSGQGLGGSDHQTFLKRSIPALHLFSGVHPDYHRPSDDTERFEAEGTRRVVALALDLVVSAQSVRSVDYVEPEVEEAGARRAGGFRTYFGSIPEYAYDGKGLLLSGTSAGSPAERAGLLRGDILVGMDDIVIDTIHDFMFGLNAHKPGDVVLVRYLREGEEQSVRLTLGTRDLE